MKLACVPLFIGACALFYFGSGMLLVVPGDPGENYLKSVFTWRFLYGVVPTVSSAVLLVVTGWLWSRSEGSANPTFFIGRAFACAIGAIVLFWLCLLIIAGMRQE